MVRARMELLALEESEVQRKIDKLLTTVMSSPGMVADRMSTMLQKLDADAAELATERRALAAGNTDAVATLCATAPILRTVWNGAGPQERRDVVRAFVARIEVDGVQHVLRIALRTPAGAAPLRGVEG